MPALRTLIAHALTALRLVAAAPFAWLLLRTDAASTLAAGAVLALAIATDFLDGRIARRRGTASAGGRLFDHASDCGFVCAGLWALAVRGVVPALLPPLVALAFVQYALDSRFGYGSRELVMSALGRWNGILYFVPLVGDVGVRLVRAPLAPLVGWIAWGLVVTTLLSILDRLQALARRLRAAPGSRAEGTGVRSRR